jgi:transposase-like protein
MGWKETCAVEERMRFVVVVQKQEESFAAVCRRFGISRRTGYKWLARFEEEGAAGLFDHSRAPLHHPQTISSRIAERCLEVRRASSELGTRKGASLSGAAGAGGGVAGGEHDWRTVRPRRVDGEAQAAPAQPALKCAFCPLRGSQ